MELGRSQYTVRGDLYTVLYFARWLGRDPRSATRADLLRFAGEYRARCTSSATLSRLSALRSFFAWCRPDDNPALGVRVRRLAPEPKRPFTTSELQRLLAACLSPRDRAIVLLFVATGIRRGEMAGLRARDIDWGRGLLLIEGKGHKRRWVAPGPAALAALRLCLDGDDVLFRSRFGRPLTRDAVYQVVKAISRRAGVRGYVHKFRVTWANEFLRQTHGDIQSAQVLLGHAKISQTAHYAAWSRAERALEQAQRVSLADRIVG